MAGTPKKRAKIEAAAKAAAEKAAAEQAAGQAAVTDKTEPVDTDRPYTAEQAAKVVELLTEGVALNDVKLGDEVLEPGIASTIGVSVRTITRWQSEYADFAEAVKNAREESSHRIADQIKALAAQAMKDPSKSNACRVAGDLLKWSAMVRNRGTYGEKSEVTVNKVSSYIDALKRVEDADNELLRQAKLTADGGDKPAVIH